MRWCFVFAFTTLLAACAHAPPALPPPTHATVALQPTAWPAEWNDRAWLAVEEGVVHYQQGEIHRALRSLQRAQRNDPSLVIAWNLEGTVRLNFYDYAGALTRFDEALRHAPTDYDALIGRGIALRGLQRFEEAQDSYVLAMEQHPQRADAFYNLGVLFSRHRPDSCNAERKGRLLFQQFVGRADPVLHRAQLEQASLVPTFASCHEPNRMYQLIEEVQRRAGAP